MKQFVTLTLFKSFEKVNFYTFQIDDTEQTETDKFFNRFENDENSTVDLNNLTYWLSLIGEKYEAKQEFFRHEGAAEALPPPYSKMVQEVIVNNLRLYCVRLSDNIVILANGGVKTSQKVQDSPDLLRHFHFANNMSKQITDLIRQRELIFKGKNILNLNEIELTY